MLKRSHIGLRWALNAIQLGSLEEDGHVKTRRCLVKTGAEVGVRHLQAKGCQGLPTILEAKRRIWDRDSLRPSERTLPTT